MNTSKYYYLGPCIFLFLVLFLLFCPMHFKLYNQTYANEVPGALVRGMHFGEEIYFSLPNVSRVDVLVGTFNRVNDSLLTCHIIQEGHILASRTIDARHCRNNKAYSLYFRPAVELKPEKGFTILWESNALVEKDNYTTLYFSNENRSDHTHFVWNYQDHYDKNMWIRVYSRLTVAQLLRYSFRNEPDSWKIVVPWIVIVVMSFGVLVLAHGYSQKIRKKYNNKE